MSKICSNWPASFILVLSIHYFLKLHLTAAQADQLYCPEGWTRLGDHCYVLRSSSALSWNDAYDACRSSHAHLVVIGDVDELRALASHFPGGYWIGLSKNDRPASHESRCAYRDGIEARQSDCNQRRTFMCKTFPLLAKGTLYGDLFVPDNEPHTSIMHDAAYKGKGIVSYDYWPPSRSIFYKIVGFSTEKSNFILQSLKYVQTTFCERCTSMCGLQFRPAGNGNEASIKFGTGGKGCYSSWGQPLSSGAIVHLANDCFYPSGKFQGIVVHEILHALGVPHEHMRYDRDDHVSINFHNIDSGKRDQFTKIEKRLPLWNQVPYDFRSLMHYDENSFGTNTISLKRRPSPPPGDQDWDMGQRSTITSRDIQKLKNLFQCNGNQPPPPPSVPEPPPVVRNGKCHVEYERDIVSGRAVQTIHNRRKEDCCDLCNANSDCRGFAWNDHQNGTCWLKSTSGPMIQWGKTIAGYVKGRENLAANEDAEFVKQHCTILGDNTDIHGGEKAKGMIPGETFPGCCRRCHEEPRCKAYTWTENGSCYLKTASDGQVNNPGRKSGILRSRQNQAQPRTSSSSGSESNGNAQPCSTLHGVDIQGGRPVGQVSNRRFEQCCGECMARSECKAFAWNDFNGGTCWLKSASDNRKNVPNVKSGVVVSRG